MFLRIARSIVAGLALTAIAWGLMIWRHPLLRAAFVCAIQQDVDRSRAARW